MENLIFLGVPILKHIRVYHFRVLIASAVTNDCFKILMEFLEVRWCNISFVHYKTNMYLTYGEEKWQDHA